MEKPARLPGSSLCGSLSQEGASQTFAYEARRKEEIKSEFDCFFQSRVLSSALLFHKFLFVKPYPDSASESKNGAVPRNSLYCTYRASVSSSVK